METNYRRLILRNLEDLPERSRDLTASLPAAVAGDTLCLKAFGEACCLGPGGVRFSSGPDDGPRGLLVSLYARHVTREPLRLKPLKAFRDFRDSSPYQGAFAANAERVLVPLVPRIAGNRQRIMAAFDGEKGPPEVPGDLSFVLHPLPKIALCYIFYLPDEDFAAAVTCLFSSNARDFMPLDGLADVAEYTSRAMAAVVEKREPPGP